MKRLFFMLLIIFAAVTTVSAQRKYRVNSPTNVIKTFEFICDLYGNKNSQVYSINKNPNTGIIESKEVVTSFSCKKSEPYITMIADDFHKDESVCYQLMHLAPGNIDNFSIKVATGNGATKTVRIRTHQKQEMWYMAAKNPTNPQLRDVYAIVWEDKDAENVVGKVFMISSLRPDLFEKDMEKDTSKTFTLDGRMGDDISDSLYVFYMADTYEELNRLVMMTDSYAELKEYMLTHDNILPMPVSRDRRFNISVDIDKRMGGRIRTVMPDGSLCKLWTNIDMVPGETYHITTHNGYYNGDYDYDRRVGLHSGKSMFEGKENDDVELTGGYNNVVADTLLVDDTVVDEEWHQAVAVDNPIDRVTPAQRMVIEQKGKLIEQKLETIKSSYKSMGEIMAATPNMLSIPSSFESAFKNIIKLNNELDKLVEDFINVTSKQGLPAGVIIGVYKSAIDDLFKPQNQAFNMFYKNFGSLSPNALKCQKQVNKLTEKYMNKMNKAMLNIK